jgi:hypothetical protein
MQSLALVPMHSDSQQFVRVAAWFETFTAVTRARISPQVADGMRIVYLPVDCDVNSLDQKLSVPTLDEQASRGRVRQTNSWTSSRAERSWVRWRMGIVELRKTQTPLPKYCEESVRSGSERCDFIRQNIGVRNGVCGHVWRANRLESIIWLPGGSSDFDGEVIGKRGCRRIQRYSTLRHEPTIGPIRSGS